MTRKYIEIVALFALSPSATADIITVDFTGEVTSEINYPFFSVGDDFNGSFSIDTTRAGVDQNASPAQSHFGGLGDHQFVVGTPGSAFTGPGGSDRDEVRISDNFGFGFDRIDIADESNFTGNLLATTSLLFQIIGDSNLINSSDLSSLVGLSVSDFSNFQLNAGRLLQASIDTDGTALRSQEVRFSLNSLFATSDASPISVPEPGTLTLFGIGLLGLVLAQKKPRKSK